MSQNSKVTSVSRPANKLGSSISCRANSGVKKQALMALGMMGEFSLKKISDVVAVFDDEDPSVVELAVAAVAAMGPEAKVAFEALDKLKTRGSKKDEKPAKDLPVEYYDKLATQVIKAIKEAKPAAAKN